MIRGGDEVATHFLTREKAITRQLGTHPPQSQTNFSEAANTQPKDSTGHDEGSRAAGVSAEGSGASGKADLSTKGVRLAASWRGLQAKGLSFQLASAINVIQWLSIEERANLKGRLPEDVYYVENYARWKDWNVWEACTLKRTSDCLSCFQLRSLLLSRCDSLLSELERTVFGPVRCSLYSMLATICQIPQGLQEGMIREALSGVEASTMLSFLPSETGLGFILRDRGSAAEERRGVIQFECVTNDREPGKMVKMLALKSIFSRQLPKMPREYLARLTFDRQHYSLALLKQGRVIGGVCFRPFFVNRFAEIVFLAVTSTEQVKGYGTRLMNHLKEFVRHRGIDHFLTYADNFALGYFRKQGFSSKVTLPKERWQGFIKDYDGGTLMQCDIDATLDYLSLATKFQQQRQTIKRATRLVRPLRIYSGRALWQNVDIAPTVQAENQGLKTKAATASVAGASSTGASADGPRSGTAANDAHTRVQAGDGPAVVSIPAPGASLEPQEAGSVPPLAPIRLDPATVPGFVEAGWTAATRKPKKKVLPLNQQVLALVEVMLRHEASWPFRKPVSKQEAPDYHEYIKRPMDISTIRRNAKNKQYKTKAQVAADLKLMFDNCRYYNMANSIYYKLADELEAAIWPHYEDIDDDSSIDK